MDYQYRAKIIKVVDGDTVDIDIDLGFDVHLTNQRIRLKGVDTPESRTRDLLEKKYGLLAKDFVKSYLKVGQWTTLQTFKDDKGKFGRILGDFIVYDHKKDAYVSLVGQIIENHHGVAYHGQSKDDIQEQHLKNRQLLQEIIGPAVENS